MSRERTAGAALRQLAMPFLNDRIRPFRPLVPLEAPEPERQRCHPDQNWLVQVWKLLPNCGIAHEQRGCPHEARGGRHFIGHQVALVSWAIQHFQPWEAASADAKGANFEMHGQEAYCTDDQYTAYTGSITSGPSFLELLTRALTR